MAQEAERIREQIYTLQNRLLTFMNRTNGLVVAVHGAEPKESPDGPPWPETIHGMLGACADHCNEIDRNLTRLQEDLCDQNIDNAVSALTSAKSS